MVLLNLRSKNILERGTNLEPMDNLRLKYCTGPNSITVEYASWVFVFWLHTMKNSITYYRIWEPFIPFPYLQVFQRGAYYSVEVIPKEVAAISLNTLYFYNSNKGEFLALPTVDTAKPRNSGQWLWLP